MVFNIVEVDGVPRATDVAGQSTLPVSVSIKRSASTDAFNRLRVSQPTTIFDSKHIFDSQSLYFTQALVGGATITHNITKAAVVLQTTTASGDKATHQTKRYFNYQPGKSHLVMQTFNFNGSATNVRKRAGYFDDNNGFFLELLVSGMSLIKRTNTSGSPVDSAVAQAAWNLDPLDGTGPSGKTLDFTKTQLLAMDFQWLGVGSARVGFVIDGELVYAHEFHHANVSALVYIRSANLPIRYEIENTGIATGTPSIDTICATVISEGGQHITGTTRSADRGITALQTDSTLRPLISIRNKTAYANASVFPVDTSIMSSTDSNFRWAVLMNPTITGGTAASWTSVADSAVEFDIARNGTVSGGTQLSSGYSPDNLNVVVADINSILSLSTNLAGVADEIVVVVQTLSTAPEDFYASLSWIELP